MKKLIQVFNIIVLIIPMTLALMFSSICFFSGWGGVFPDHTFEYYFEFPMTGRFIAIIVCILFVALAIGIKYLIDKYVYNRILVEICIVFVIALVLRLTVIISNKNTLIPFSDFNRVWEMAHGTLEGHLEYYSLFPAYLNYTVFIKNFIGLVGDSFVSTLYLNVVFSSATSVVIYFIAREVTKHNTIPYFSAIIYSLMPSNIFYCSVMTPEFITVFFDSCGVFLILIAIKRKWDIKKVIILLGSGVLFGIGSSYKSFGIVILIAFTICLLISAVFGIIKKREWNKLLFGMLALLLVFGSYKISKELILVHTEKEFGIRLDESDSLPHFLLVGLNTEGEGQIHIGNYSRRYYQSYLENGYDTDAAKNDAYELLKTDWKENSEKIPNLILHKLIWAWQDDQIPLRYFIIATESNTDISFMGLSVATLMQAYYMIVMLGAMIGSLISWKNIDLRKEFILLIIFGFFCIILLSEAQSRYKCLITPFICIISGMGLEGTIKSLKSVCVALRKTCR